MPLWHVGQKADRTAAMTQQSWKGRSPPGTRKKECWRLKGLDAPVSLDGSSQPGATKTGVVVVSRVSVT